MVDHAKIWTEQFIDEDGAPYGLCYAQFYDVTGASRKAVWTDRDKTLPSAAGSLLDIDGDVTGRITAYGDGVYRIVVRAAGDDGSNSPVAVFEGVQLVDAEEAYDGATDPFTLEALEEDALAGQGRQAAATSAQSGTTLDLSLFDAAGRTYLVEGTASLLTFQYVTLEDYEAGARITLECTTNPIKLRARRDGEASGSYNLEIGSDFLMPVGSSIDLELRGGLWYERSRFVYDPSYDDFEGTGVASAANLIVPGGNAAKVTGTTNITNVYWVLTSQTAPPGTRLDLYFTGALTVSDGGGNLALDGDFETAAGSVLGLRSLGATGWVEVYRKPTANTTLTIGSGSTPSVKGAATVLLTGNNHDDVARLTDPVLGKTVTIINTDTTTPNDDYLNARKRFQHAGSASAGYLSLQYGADFYMIAGDTLTLTCLSDGSVLYWKEVARTEDDAWPALADVTGTTTGAGAGTIAPWRPNHTLNCGSQQYLDGTTTWLGDGRTLRLRLKTGSNDIEFQQNAAGTDLQFLTEASGDTMTEEWHLMAFFAYTTHGGVRQWAQVLEGSQH